MTSILRIGEDPGYLSNKRMALEIGVGLAHLSGRTLSAPIDAPIGWGPRPALVGAEAGPPSTLPDLYEIPVSIMGDEAYGAATAGHSVHQLDWPQLGGAVFVDPSGPEPTPELSAFVRGREIISFDAATDRLPILEVPGRCLAFYSFFFHVEPAMRRELFGLLGRIRPRPGYRDLGRAVSEALWPFNAAHIRRTDHLAGVRAYRQVSPRMIADNLAGVFPADERLVVCTEADPESDVFLPLRSTFADVVFLNQHILGASPWRERFFGLARHDDSALALIGQEVAARAERFAGTMSSTFTGMIHRRRCVRDPGARFLFTADFLGGESRFEGCEYQPVQPGQYSWNRVAYPVSSDALAWMREWPEVAR